MPSPATLSPRVGSRPSPTGDAAASAQYQVGCDEDLLRLSTLLLSTSCWCLAKLVFLLLYGVRGFSCP